MDGMMIIATAPITDIILITFCGPIKCSLKKACLLYTSRLPARQVAKLRKAAGEAVAANWGAADGLLEFAAETPATIEMCIRDRVRVRHISVPGQSEWTQARIAAAALRDSGRFAEAVQLLEPYTARCV